MRISPLKASVVALALFAGVMPALAASGQDGTMVVAQADEGGGNAKQLDAIRKFIANGKNISRLDTQRLQQRQQRAERLLQIKNLPDDLRSGLDQQLAAIKDELSRRSQSGAANTGNAQATDNQQASSGAGADTAGQPAGKKAGANAQAQQQAGAAAETPADVQSFLGSVQPVAGLNDQQLRVQTRTAAQFIKNQPTLAPAVRRQLRQVVVDGRAEIQRRGAGAGQSAGQAGQAGTQAAGQQQAGTAPASGDVATYLQQQQGVNIATLNDQQLRQRIRQAAIFVRAGNVPKDQLQQLRVIIRDGRAELQRRQTAGGAGQQGTGTTQQGTGTGQTGTGMTQQNQNGSNPAQLDNTKVDAASETKAKAYLIDNVDASKLSKQELRTRLAGMRDLLQANQLSRETKLALRRKLAADRQVLRNEVAPGAGAGASGSNGTSNSNNTNVTVNNNTTINNTNVKVVLNDRRPSRDLNDVELQRRIDVYRDAVNDNRFAQNDREQIRIILQRDRDVLRQRMLEQRQARADRLRRNRDNLDINLSLNFQPDRPPPPRYVFAAEADDAEITDILTAPPRRKIERRYTVEEVETNPQLRDAVARIEIDTVHFGFGEGFLREEEIDKLDRIAEVMEKVLAKSPGEVFMIEGHTDAVGSDDANLQLSRERAKAVKDALTTYYVIPADNLKTVGFGERYLKIPTADPEPENRRVSIARITPLVGSAE